MKIRKKPNLKKFLIKTLKNAGIKKGVVEQREKDVFWVNFKQKVELKENELGISFVIKNSEFFITGFCPLIPFAISSNHAKEALFLKPIP